MSDWNTQVIEEFRANGGRVGGNFAGANMILLHHVGRKSGEEYVTPLVYFTDPVADPSPIYIAASAAGAPKHPQWYANLVAAGRVTAEVGTDTVELRVEELHGAERDRVWSIITSVNPGFSDYETKTQGIRTIPVLALHR